MHILENVLFGSVLTVNGNDLLVLAIVGSLVISVTVSTVFVGWLMQRLIRRRRHDTPVQP